MRVMKIIICDGGPMDDKMSFIDVIIEFACMKKQQLNGKLMSSM